MERKICQILGHEVEVVQCNTAVVGSGAAGFNAADRLYQFGQKDIVLITEDINAGTSRNTGSDKQTYYKLSLCGEDPDSVSAMAQVYFSGRCVDGEHALCEAALSARCFLRLAELGVPFPQNRYGEYVGYKTDHDPNRRATSVGPYTSKQMTECLEKSVREKNIRILDHWQVIRILTAGNKVEGLLCIRPDDGAYKLCCCKNVIYATGGPAGMYADSVYPLGHWGASGLAFAAGAVGKNLTEWQYGLASVAPRWNVSGTYMQVLPRFISTDADGNDQREFLGDYYQDYGEMLTNVFLKGYQWPFDVRKIQGGSSMIDILVYIETALKGRRVFLDFRSNPAGRAVDFRCLQAEAREYLEKAGACYGTPLERLLHMNEPAVAFYREHGVDLAKEPLEIALCAQHNNGGLAIDAWWQTSVEGLFAAGEVSASHGVYRPGGSALNAGQVGSTRAAQYIAARRAEDNTTLEELLQCCGDQLEEELRRGEKALARHGSTVPALLESARRRMSRVGAAIRSGKDIREALNELERELSQFDQTVSVAEEKDLAQLYRLHDVLLSQYVYLSAFSDYIRNNGASRGSALYTDPAGILPAGLPERFRFTLEDSAKTGMIQEVSYSEGRCSFSWRLPREIPHRDDFFENVWRSYRENGNIE